MDLGTLLLLALTTARLTRLVTDDRVTERLRVALARRRPEGMLAYFLYCPWCVSMYAGAVVAGSWWAWGGQTWHTALMLALSASYTTGYLASRTED